MKAVFLGLVAAISLVGAMNAVAQSPGPTATASPVTSVPQFPSAPHSLRALPGPAEDSWYVYASGFPPRTRWYLVEVLCPERELPCGSFGAAFDGHANEDGTMSFYAILPRADGPAATRLLAAMPDPVTGVVPAGSPTIEVAGHNPGTGLGYPKGTRTGIAPVDEVVALVEAFDTAAIRSRLVLKSGENWAGEAMRGVASWQCQPYIQAEENLDNIFEYPSGLVYAVFRIPQSADLPLRYAGADFGIAWWDGGAGIPLGGLILVSDAGQIAGTEIRCGTTPGFHVHHFTDFVLAPFAGPPPATVTPQPPDTGSGQPAAGSATGKRTWSVALAMLVAAASGAAVVAARERQHRDSR